MNTKLNSLLVMAMLSAPAVAGVVVLDDFDSTPNDDAFGARSSFSSFVNDDPFGQGGTTVIDTAFSFDGNNGALIMNSGIGARQEANLSYDAAGVLFDFSSTGTLSFDFIQVDQDFSIRVLLLDELGGKAVAQIDVSAGGVQSVEYDILNDSSFQNIDLSRINSADFFFNNAQRNDDDEFIHTASLDFVLTSISAVPSPSGVAVMALGGLAMSRRRR